MSTHNLKTWPSFFRAVERGEKTFEIRFHDRDFAVDDKLHLAEWDPQDGYTGRYLTKRITYVMLGGQFGLAERWVILGLGEPNA